MSTSYEHNDGLLLLTSAIVMSIIGIIISLSFPNPLILDRFWSLINWLIDIIKLCLIGSILWILHQCYYPYYHHKSNAHTKWYRLGRFNIWYTDRFDKDHYKIEDEKSSPSYFYLIIDLPTSYPLFSFHQEGSDLRIFDSFIFNIFPGNAIYQIVSKCQVEKPTDRYFRYVVECTKIWEPTE